MKIILVTLFFIFFSASAFSQTMTPEDAAIRSMMIYCLPPIVTGEDIGEYAVKQKLPELPSEKAALFDKNGGRAFAIPAALGNAVLVARTAPGRACSIAMRTGNAQAFWPLVDIYFGTQTPFKVAEEKALPEGGKQKTLQADFKGPTMLILSMRDKPVADGMQGLMSFSRYKP